MSVVQTRTINVVRSRRRRRRTSVVAGTTERDITEILVRVPAVESVELGAAARGTST